MKKKKINLLPIMRVKLLLMNKKVIVIGLMMLLLASANAQRIGGKVGISLSNATSSISNIESLPENVIGMHAGLIGEVKLFSGFYLNSGILLSQKGFCADSITPSLSSGHVQVNYLEAPLNLAVKFNMGVMKLFVQAGPYLDYGFNASHIFEDTSLGKIKIEFDDDVYHINRIDYGAGFGAGIEVSILQIAVNYSIGLTDISSTDEIEIKNGVFGISAAMLF